MKPGGFRVNHTLHNSRGFTLFEIILALLILAIAIIPMVNAFAPALLSGSQGEEQAVLTGCARRTMNRLLDLNFQTLNANLGPDQLTNLLGEAEALKENLNYQGRTYAPVVAITDASSGAGGLLELTVTLKNVSLQTLKAER
jgi:prepilin-type N-terminal cleavage/methylation domain-containing protein